MHRAAVFVDGGYVRGVLRYFGEPRIDYERFSDEICRPAERLRTYYYDCLPHLSDPPSEEELERRTKMERFVNSLKGKPRFEVRLGRQTARTTGGGGRFRQKQVDVMMALDLVRLSWLGRIDFAVLVTGDDDFVPAVRAAKDHGVLVRLCYLPTNVGEELWETCDERLEVTPALIDSVRLEGGGGRRR